jgi:hypothetical protein
MPLAEGIGPAPAETVGPSDRHLMYFSVLDDLFLPVSLPKSGGRRSVVAVGRFIKENNISLTKAQKAELDALLAGLMRE